MADSSDNELDSNNETDTNDNQADENEPTDLTVYYGQYYSVGITDGNKAEDPRARAEIGIRIMSDSPWTWYSAQFHTTGAGDSENNHEYAGTITAPAPGDYEIKFRYSLNCGMTWQAFSNTANLTVSD